MCGLQDLIRSSPTLLSVAAMVSRPPMSKWDGCVGCRSGRVRWRPCRDPTDRCRGRPGIGGRLNSVGDPIEATWLGRIAYREAWERQKALVEKRAAGDIADQLLLLEHDSVLTLGRQADESHVLARPSELRRRGIEVIRVERGGEVTYHGPGQLVAYPILRLGDRGLLVRPLVTALEEAMITTCAELGVTAYRRDGHPGCWVGGAAGGAAAARPPRKIGALGLRIERGVSYHGIALNIDPDLRDFELIDPCGEPGLISAS